MHILVSNVYSYKNKGDAAIVIALVNEIRRAFPGADVRLQTTDILHDQDKYGAPITSSLLWILLSSVRDKPIVSRLLHVGWGIASVRIFLACARVFGIRPTFLLSKALRTFISDNSKADMVIACGGGYLRTATASFHDTLLLYVTCLNFLAAKYLGKRVYLYSQSIGPVHGALQKRILRHALNHVDIIEPREDISLDYLQSLELTPPIVMTADPALLLGGSGIFPRVVRLARGRLHVGITVRKWFNSPDDLQFYVQAVAKNIDYLVERHNAEVFYIPQVIAENFGDDDRVVAEQVHAQVRHKDRFTLITADLHPNEVIGLCGHMDIFIGTRMHSNIFALIGHVPVIAIEYEHKTRGIMRGLGLEELTIDIRDVTPESLQAKIELLLKGPIRYKKMIIKHLPAQIGRSRKAIEIIKDDYASYAQR